MLTGVTSLHDVFGGIHLHRISLWILHNMNRSMCRISFTLSCMVLNAVLLQCCVAARLRTKILDAFTSIRVILCVCYTHQHVSIVTLIHVQKETCRSCCPYALGCFMQRFGKMDKYVALIFCFVRPHPEGPLIAWCFLKQFLHWLHWLCGWWNDLLNDWLIISRLIDWWIDYIRASCPLWLKNQRVTYVCILCAYIYIIQIYHKIFYVI
jgi:hypothetical protein